MKTLKHHPENEKLKRRYATRMTEVGGLSATTIDKALAAVTRFEESTGFRPFKRFHVQQVIAFKGELRKPRNGSKCLSASSQSSILKGCRGFFAWLADQPGFRSTVRYSDLDYFSLSAKEERIAKAARPKTPPTPEQIETALSRAPTTTIIERRDRAIVAFLWLTGARDGAAIGFRLRHIDVANGVVHQLGAETNTKFGKTFDTWFFPVGETPRAILEAWIAELTVAQGFAPDDALFPATHRALDANRRFSAQGLSRNPWKTAQPLRLAVRRVFEAAGYPYFNPHLFRDALARLGTQRCYTAEQLKAWSQNLGHERMTTTLTSYGTVEPSRQAELIKTMSTNELNLSEIPTRKLWDALNSRLQSSH